MLKNRGDGIKHDLELAEYAESLEHRRPNSFFHRAVPKHIIAKLIGFINWLMSAGDYLLVEFFVLRTGAY